MTEEQILEFIPRIAAVEDPVEQSLCEWVGRLRERGVTWERIGAALGMTSQSARGRFSGEQWAVHRRWWTAEHGGHVGISGLVSH